MPNAKVLFKFGTAAQYAALETKLDNALYFLLDTNELYRGSIPFGKPHVYTGIREQDATDAATITALLNGNTPIQGDIVVITNTDNSSDAFLYSEDEEEWLHIGNTATDSLATRVTTLEGAVADLEAALSGTETEDGLEDRVADLETALAGLSGAFHFKGSVEDLATVTNPSEGDVYQVGDAEYAWNGNAWVELGGTFDLSNYVTTTDLNDAVANLEALIGQPASTSQQTDPVTGETTEVTTPATGVYADLATRADEIIPIFNGIVAGLVPVDDSNATTAEKANHFLNALGNWVNVSSSGQATYTDPEGHTYNTVEEYVTYMLANHVEAMEYVWQSIDENE